MTGGQNLGGATGHIKAITLLPFPHQRKVHTEGLLGRHALIMHAWGEHCNIMSGVHVDPCTPIKILSSDNGFLSSNIAAVSN